MKMKKIKKTIFFRTDGHEEIGMGHLQRCHNLSQAILNTQNDTENYQVHYFIEKKSETTLQKLTGYSSYSIVTKENAAQEMSDYLDQNRLGPSILIADGYHLTKHFFSQLKKNRPSLIKLAFDDAGEKLDYAVDGFINTSITSKLFSYPNKNNILGLDFFPLRNEFQKLKIRERNRVETLLITMGGGDPYLQTERLAKIAGEFPFLKEIQLVLGPLSQPTPTLQKIIASDSRFKLFQAPQNFAELLSQADFVISAGGSTVHELLFLKIPFAALILSSDQATVLQALESSGFKGNLGNYKLSSDEEISMILESLLKTPVTLLSTQIDGQGSKRLKDKVLEIHHHYFQDKFSTEAVVTEYARSSQATDHFEKVKWGSPEGMLNAFHLGQKVINWNEVKNWLDIGSGTGDFLLEVEKKQTIASFHGLDLSPELLAVAKGRAYQTTNLHFHLQDFLYPLEKNHTTFDLVTSIGVLQKCGLPLQTAVARLAEWVKSGGQLFITTKNADWSEFKKEGFVPYSGHHWFSLLELETAFLEAGLDIVQFAGWEPRSNTIVGRNESHTVFILATRK